MTLGPVRVDGPVAEIARSERGAFIDPVVSANVGGGFLKRFTVTFDYARQKVVFEPNASVGEREVFDRSGLWLNRAAGKGLVVADVTAVGPGADAGLEIGDFIVSVDGEPAGGVSLPALRGRFRSDPPGTKVRFGVERGSARREVTLVLRDLV